MSAWNSWKKPISQPFWPPVAPLMRRQGFSVSIPLPCIENASTWDCEPAGTPMNLRQQLFLSSSALMVVALVGLLLGTFSVLQLTKGQSREMSRNMEIIDASLAMHQELSKQITLMISENLDRPALQQSRQR